MTLLDRPVVAASPEQHRPRRRLLRLTRLLFVDGFRAAPGWMALVAAMLVLGSIASTSYPLGYGLLVDGALDSSVGRLVAGVAVVGGLLTLGWLLTALGATEAMALSDRVSIFRTSKLISLISGVPGMQHLERPDYLSQVERLNTNRRQLAAAPRTMLTSVSTVARVITMLVLLATFSPWLLLLPVCAVPPMVCDRIARRISRQAEDAGAHTARLATMLFGLTTSAQTAAEVRAYGLTDHLAAEHRRLSDELDRRGAREALQVLGVQALGWILYAAGLMSAVALVAVRASAGAYSLGAVLAAVSLIRRSRRQLAGAAQTSSSLSSTLTTADRLLWLEDHADAERARGGSVTPPPRLTSGLQLDGVSFAYPGTERTVLDDVSLTIPAGTTVALVGENGSGKSTLVKLLLGLYEPVSGTVLVDGVDLQDLAPAAWRARCTAAFQDFSRLHSPAVRSIGVADVDRADDEPLAQRALVAAGSDRLVDALPHGLQTPVGSRYTGGQDLSGGQWQKIALARAMRRADPLLVVLDEPTASLDAGAEHGLFTRYAGAARAAASSTGAVTLLVSHRFSTVTEADVIVYLEGGRVVEQGSHDDLLVRGGRYAELYAIQAEGYR